MKQQGSVFDIQGFSVHDGPGIRTLVFLKGCPLRCSWCANPESQRSEPDLLFIPANCIGCQNCLNVCPQGAVRCHDQELLFTRDKCVNCGRCVENCYAEARVLKGRSMCVEEVLDQILKDAPFYSGSGGGITLGGGEPLSQPDFATALLNACGERGLHTTVETAGNIPWENLAQVVPYTDLFLFDVKHTDPVKLAAETGADAALTLHNLANLSRCAKQLIVRTPVVPGFNDTAAEIRSIARLLRSLCIPELHLLPYHPYGQGKYQLLGRSCRFSGPADLAPGVLDGLQRVAAAEGLQVQVGG